MSTISTDKSRYKTCINKFGYEEVEVKPTSKELEEYYNSHYFSKGTYSYEYTESEWSQKFYHCAESEVITKQESGNFLDIGCGEGFSMSYFDKKGWNVRGIDFTSDGVKRNFPELEDKLVVGDLLEKLDQLAEEGVEYDLIYCNNVLEHVIDVDKLMNSIMKLVSKNTVLRLQVPNDNSWLQNLLVKKELAPDGFWLCPPDHLSYFNADNIDNYMKHYNLDVFDKLGDFPIELFLLNKASNYKLDDSVGKHAHTSRIDFDVNLFNKSVEGFVNFRRGCGLSGVGRNVIVYCKLNS